MKTILEHIQHIMSLSPPKAFVTEILNCYFQF